MPWKKIDLEKRRSSRTAFSRKLPKIVIVRKSYVIITKEGVKFVRKQYSNSVSLDREEIKVYGFLIRLISFGGILPLALIKRQGRTEILKKALKNEYAIVTTFIQDLPRKEVQEAIQEIWGKAPKGFYV